MSCSLAPCLYAIVSSMAANLGCGYLAELQGLSFIIYFPHFFPIPTLNAVSQSAFLQYNSVNNYCTIQDIKMNLVNKKYRRS